MLPRMNCADPHVRQLLEVGPLQVVQCGSQGEQVLAPSRLSAKESVGH